MEYDKSTTVPTNTPLETLPASNQHTAEQPRHQTSSNSSNNNNSSSNNNSDNETNQHIRVASKPDVDISVLGTPITFAFCGKTAPNRFLKAPMTERLCRWNDEGRGEDVTYRGYPTPEYSLLYQRWGEGEIGTIIFGNTMIDYTAVEAYGNPILVDDHDNRVSAFREIVQLTKKPHNALAIVQLSHPGRQGSKALNPHPISASDVHLKLKWAGNEFAPPRAMSLDDIRHNIKQWGQSAYLAWQAGFDGVQIHCAHGYLLAQFLSPSTNLRTDSYGGTPTNRARLIFEIIAEIDRRVRTHDPTFLLCVKLNSVEFQDRGTTPQEARDLCIALEAARVDFVDLSGGTFEGRAFHHVKDSTRAREAYFIEFAEMIRPLLQKTKVFVTGGFRSASGMALAVEQGACDGVGIGRPLAAEPYLCRDILAGRVSGAIENLVPLPMNTQASGTQLHQVAKGEELVSDWSASAEVERWIEENERETKRKIQVLPRVDSSGFPWLRAERGFAYLK